MTRFFQLSVCVESRAVSVSRRSQSIRDRRHPNSIKKPSHFSCKKSPARGYFTTNEALVLAVRTILKMMAKNEEESNKILRLPAVLERIQLSRSTIYAMLKRGDFPQPVKLGVRARAWRAEDIENWIESRESV